MLYSNNQIALYLNLASGHIKRDGHLRYLTGKPSPKLTGGGNLQETQILFVRDALWIANNDDSDTLLQQSLLNMLGIGTPQALIEHVAAYQGRVFNRIKIQGEMQFDTPSGPAEEVMEELCKLDELGNAKDIVYPADMVGLPIGGVSNPKYKLTSPDGDRAKPPVSGIVFVVGNYEGSGDGINEHAEQKLLAALSRVPDSITGTLPLFGCKRQCSVCEDVFDRAMPRLRSSYRYLNCRAHSDTKITKYQAQAHPSNIKALDVDQYFPA